MIDSQHRLMTRKADPGDTLRDRLPEHGPLAEGEVVLALDRFSLTTNNITYAAYGDAIGYWKVFPTGRDDYGLMPVWGFADVASPDTAEEETAARIVALARDYRRQKSIRKALEVVKERAPSLSLPK